MFSLFTVFLLCFYFVRYLAYLTTTETIKYTYLHTYIPQQYVIVAIMTV